jgi:hypothetical protein
MRAATAAVSLVALALTATPAAADWLVLRDGTRVETRGAWREEGRLIVFTSQDGQLASLRGDTVDLASSRRATVEAKTAAERSDEPAPAAPAAPPAAVRRITNADIPAGSSAPPAGGGEAATGAEDGSAGAPAQPAAGALAVGGTAQEVDPVTGHLIVRGTLTNTSQQTAAAVELVVHAQGADGNALGTLPARLDREALRPGASSRFEVHFFDVYSGAFALRFTPSATFLETTGEGGADRSFDDGGEGLEGGSFGGGAFDDEP